MKHALESLRSFNFLYFIVSIKNKYHLEIVLEVYMIAPIPVTEDWLGYKFRRGLPDNRLLILVSPRSDSLVTCR